jgi:hypothetical protein
VAGMPVGVYRPCSVPSWSRQARMRAATSRRCAMASAV